jgi:hypothetical protein
MPFPQSVKVESQILSARHCCVCHRYKGLKIETHHIVQEADGGANTLENAVDLCFDCHCDAGNYNKHHPRGSKYSLKEIRLARDKWNQMVKENNIEPPLDVNNAIHCSYLISQSYDATTAVFRRSFKDLLFSDFLLLENAVFHFWRKELATEKHLQDHFQGSKTID